MRAEDLILVSVDDHVVEPPDLFEGRLEAKYADRAPRVVTKPDGTDVWLYEGNELPNVGLNAVAGRPPEEYGLDPTKFEDMRPGCYDIHERVRDMNVNGVLGSMCFPSFPQFCGQLFARTEDKDVGLAMLRAYNDWHIETWCGTYPGRFIPLALPPLWDPQLMADEVRRVAAKGCHAVTFSENPEKLGYPSFHSDHWEPFWSACADEGTVVCLHIGSSSQVVITALDAPIDTLITLQPMNIVQAAADLLWSPVLRKYPTLRVALSEGGIGWIPYFLERVDYVYLHHRAWTNQDFGDLLPSEVFKERIITCFIDDAFGVANRSYLNMDMITWECDYPHSDSVWPDAPEKVMRYMAGLPDADINKITHENAMRLFQYDPFRHIKREQATAGALRAQATDVDLALRSNGKGKEFEGIVTALTLSQMSSK
ncbi:MAG TPA: amidohydrolase family protein [Acidimicrobiales bacterium]|nr:amidohydrolase family protein [Acidimicrobiales bacterium]